MKRNGNGGRHVWLLLTVLAGWCAAGQFDTFPGGAEDAAAPAVHARLLPEVPSVQPGTEVDIAVAMTMADQWHTYWTNPGDIGLQTDFDWAVPAGVTVGEPQWPAPRKLLTGSAAPEQPDQVTYGYEDEILVLFRLHVGAAVPVGKDLELTVQVSWLACKDMCRPGSADLQLKLPVRKAAAAANANTRARFRDARRRLPLRGSAWRLAATRTANNLSLRVTAPPATPVPRAVTFIPAAKGLIADTGPQIARATSDSLSLVLRPGRNRAARLTGVLTAEDGVWAPGRTALFVDVPIVSSDETSRTPASTTAATDGEASVGLLAALLFSFLGGLILNLMPCVLPVLSLKILGFVKQAEESRKSALVHGLMFAAGVLVSFWALAGVLIALRAGGQALGWGFQLQSPRFVFCLAAFFFIFALSLFGVFEIGIGLVGLGSGSEASGLTGSFFSGCVATVVATPCTAPFMGTALGFALTQPLWAAMLVFTFLGAGMALPYVLLSTFPALLRFVPRPGAWMESFKQFLGFLLTATVVWLLSVVGQQAGLSAVVAALFALVLLAMAGWALGRWATPVRKPAARLRARVAAALLLVAGLALGWEGAVPPTADAIAWQAYSPETLQAYVAAGRPVLIDFMAEWCLTCTINDKAAFTAEVSDEMRRRGIVALKADWTNRDATIAAAMAAYGRNGVPLYVLYDSSGDYRILPQVLTPQTLLDALRATK